MTDYFVIIPPECNVKELYRGLFLPVSDDSRKIFVRIIFKPRLSFFGVITATLIIYREEPYRIDRSKLFDKASIPCLWISFNVFASMCVHLHKPFNGIFNFNRYLITVPLTNFDDRIISRKENCTSRFCTCKV